MVDMAETFEDIWRRPPGASGGSLPKVRLQDVVAYWLFWLEPYVPERVFPASFRIPHAGPRVEVPCEATPRP